MHSSSNGQSSFPQGISRRALLKTGFAAALPVAPTDTTVKSFQADRFADSVGLCAHLDSAPYVQNLDAVLRLAGLLGVRYFRDEVRPSNDVSSWRRLSARARVRSHLLVSPATNTVQEMLDFIQALGPDVVSAVEGQNEGDSAWFRRQDSAKAGWVGAVIDYQKAIFEALRQHDSTRALTVVSPTVLDYEPSDMGSLRPAAPFCDVVGLHAYLQGHQEPETEDSYAAIAWYLRNMRDTFKPMAPVMVTETGYATGISGISDLAAATYLPRLVLHLFAHGIVRSFLYEFMDEGRNASDPEQNYGLLTVDGAPKPAFHVLRQLLGALADPGPPFAADRVALTVEQGPTDLRLIPFRKRSGEVLVTLWRTARVWDPVGRRDIAVAPAMVRLRLPPRSTAATMLTLTGGSRWMAAPVRDRRLALAVQGTVQLVRIGS